MTVWDSSVASGKCCHSDGRECTGVPEKHSNNTLVPLV